MVFEYRYYQLDEDGYLSPHPYSENNDVNFNNWNLDLRYVSQFTRGSELVALYRNTIENQNDRSYLSFGENLSELLDQPYGHLLSIKVIYFLDYNNVKSWLKKENS